MGSTVLVRNIIPELPRALSWGAALLAKLGPDANHTGVSIRLNLHVSADHGFDF